ncbi:HTH-type transcriptional repressor DasR [Streptomyces spiroverticillatus]|uniref:HTH-type transcriptional repressor DasR n=1 Tax=Streptomyces finlayi TaxID=67296 RepID=A0A918WWN2_9ACTN|nr:GntR family transcriptional regulator [Streptomyces finlayi]GHA07742.1 HTH-type transcriptional repressor DasR [Streptomyces spiroverticillatus]GHC90989.1 HTH-type transcriptional repressor DasR [Streptomyces finlayi]
MGERGVPKYLQVKAALLTWIDDLEPGAALPSEVELAHDFAVSRVTMRRATTELVLEGRLTRSQGKVTRVVGEKIRIPVLLGRGHTEQMRAGGYEVSREVLDHGVAAADRRVAGELEVAPGAEVFALRRRVVAQGMPIGLETTYLARAADFAALDAQELAGSTYARLTGPLGVTLARTTERVETTPIPLEAAQALDASSEVTALVVHRVTVDAAGRPVEYSHVLYRGDRITLSYTLER